MKIKVPPSHFDFYRLLYRYLNDSIAVSDHRVHLENYDLTKSLINNYLTHHQEGLSSNLVTEVSSQNKESITNQVDTDTPQTSTLTSTGNKIKKAMDELHEQVASCKNCFLGNLRKQFVQLPKLNDSTQTKPLYPIVVLIDIPSFYDQTQGKYFSDEAGALLKKIIASIDLKLENVYYSSAVKCSFSQEISNQLFNAIPCQEHLLKEIKIFSPELIIGFGKNTYDFLFKSHAELEKNQHLQSTSFQDQLGKTLDYHGVDIVFTYHPKDLLFDPNLKKTTWEHLKALKPIIAKVKSQGAIKLN